jgi:dTDP-4-dehydrorhamnose 3,5-epimerase
MKIIEHPELEGVLEIVPRIFHDERGSFLEFYNQQAFAAAGITDVFVQDNQSISHKGVVRGMHFQNPPYDQVKLVRVVWGKGLDVVVDIRKNSPTYGRYASFMLDARQQNMIYVPSGFAHGFLALEENTILSYKCTNFYNRDMEGGIYWNDPEIGIDWRIKNPIVSEKDQQLPLLRDFKSEF